MLEVLVTAFFNAKANTHPMQSSAFSVAMLMGTLNNYWKVSFLLFEHNFSLDKNTCNCLLGQKSSLDKSLLGQQSPWTKTSLDKNVLGQLSTWTKVPWTTVTLDNRPLDNCCNTGCILHTTVLSKLQLWNRVSHGVGWGANQTLEYREVVLKRQSKYEDSPKIKTT